MAATFDPHESSRLSFTFSAFFIARPVATTLLTLALTLAGAVAFQLLPVAPLPAIDFPVVMVRAQLPGASPETMAATVATPLERAMGRIAGITELTSTSGKGSTSVIVQFDLDRNADGAARDVQAAIAAARSLLPSMPSNPTYRKFNPAGAPIMILSVTSQIHTRAQLYDLASTVLAQKISQIQGVGEVTVGGGAMPAIRVQLDPDGLNRAGISTETVRRALVAANAFIPKGVLENERSFWMLDASDQLLTVADYSALIVAQKNGAVIRLGDVAKVSMATQNARNMALANGEPAVLLIVFLASGGNIIETVDRVKGLLPQLKSWLPESVSLELRTDRSVTIRSSLHEVEKSLILSVFLVVLVTYFFLQNARATVIPAVAAPVSLIATFAVMYALGYTLDNLSLMALTVSSGFVVDDAIVVLENCMRHHELGKSAQDAAKVGSSEVGFTVVSISLSLVAVFLPLLLLGGYIGRLFREFAVVLTCAVLFSMLVSLMTTPMMCATFLGKKSERTRAGIFSTLFSRLHAAYTKSLIPVLRHPKITLFVFFLVLAANVVLFYYIPKGFFPTQDTGVIMGRLRTDQSASFQNMEEKLTRVVAAIRRDPAVAQVSAHFSGNQGGGGIFISLKPLEERKLGILQVIGRLRAVVSREPGLQVFMMPAQDIMMGGRSARSQYQYTLQSDDLAALKIWADRLTKALAKSPVMKDVDTDTEDRALETELTLDRDRLASLGISIFDVDAALHNAFGQRQVSTIYLEKNQYKVVLEFSANLLEGPESLAKIYLPGAHGLVPLLSLARVSPSFAPLSVAHQGQFAAVTLSFNLPPGESLSTARRVIEETRVAIGMPSRIVGSFQGTAKMFTDSLNSQIVLIVSAVLFLYIVLGILYESLIHPLTILSTIPSAGIGALLALFIAGKEFSVIALIGILLLAGIVKKNAIMMVDFAIDAVRAKGLSSVQAIFTACSLRFRPIMMTTAAAVFGAIPLALGQGDGAELRQPLGITIVGGLVFAQIFTLYTTPVVYLVLDTFQARLRARFARSFGQAK
ncbi:MAG: efflux RND transporter permease subunit [Desulfovibrionaceae bacterium]|nr:efflux RND transporter permease subunit [Desulfovibrionaceae bacterium]